jgi:hypothetical protein
MNSAWQQPMRGSALIISWSWLGHCDILTCNESLFPVSDALCRQDLLLL